jgi:signal transduction histidine kinase
MATSNPPRRKLVSEHGLDLRSRLLGLFLLALVPALGLMLYGASEQRRAAAAEAQQNALRHARLAAAEQARLINSAHYLLITLAQLPAIRNHDQAACVTFLSHLLSLYPPYSNFGAVDRDGDIFCSGLGANVPANISDRPYFRQAMDTRDFSVGEYALTRASGRPAISFGYPVLDDSGQVQGIVFAGLNLDRLPQFLMADVLPPATTLWVTDRRGMTLAYLPGPNQWRGRRFPEDRVLEGILAEHEGVLESVDTNGVSRLYAFTPVNASRQSDLYVVIGIPSDVAFADANQNLARNLAGLAVGAIFALLAARWGANAFILRHVDSLVAATKRLTSGDLGARAGYSGGGELGQLAGAFDEMAETLERRALDQQRAQDQIRRQTARAEALARIAGRLNAHLDMSTVLNAVCEETALALNAHAASVSLFDPSQDAFVHAVGTGLTASFAERTQPLPRSALDEHAERAGLPIVLQNVQGNACLPDAVLYAESNIHTLLCARMLHEEEWIGTLNVFTFEARTFTDDELILLQGIADEAALAIANARLYEALQQGERARANLLRKLITAQEDERMRIARELHDETGQSLTGIILGMDIIHMALTEDIQRADARLQDIKSIAEGLLSNLHRLIEDLRPSQLDDLGLLPAVAWYGEQRLKPLGIAFQLDGNGLTTRLPRSIETALFRIVQEAITNTVRHARASSVSVRLSQQDGQLRLEISDNGQGFDPQILESPRSNGKGLGLLGIRERVTILGGEFELATGPGQGTTIKARVPVREKE